MYGWYILDVFSMNGGETSSSDRSQDRIAISLQMYLLLNVETRLTSRVKDEFPCSCNEKACSNSPSTLCYNDVQDGIDFPVTSYKYFLPNLRS